MPDPKDLVGPQGQSLIKQPGNLVVLKVPRGLKLNPQFIAEISRLAGCPIIVLPMDSELIMGRLAHTEMMSIHEGIHAITGFPNIQLDNPSLGILYKCLKYVCEKTQPGDDSKEVALLKYFKSLLGQEASSVDKQ